jgi:hypothetical protein
LDAEFPGTSPSCILKILTGTGVPCVAIQSCDRHQH